MSNSIYGPHWVSDDAKPVLARCLQQGDAVTGGAMDARFPLMQKQYRSLCESIDQTMSADEVLAAEQDADDAVEELEELNEQCRLVISQRDRARREVERLQGLATKGRLMRERFFQRSIGSLYAYSALLFDAVEQRLRQKGFERRHGGKLVDVAMQPLPEQAATEAKPIPDVVRADGRQLLYCLHCRHGGQEHFEKIGTVGQGAGELWRCTTCEQLREIDVVEHRRLLAASGY